MIQKRTIVRVGMSQVASAVGRDSSESVAVTYRSTHPADRTTIWLYHECYNCRKHLYQNLFSFMKLLIAIATAFLFATCSVYGQTDLEQVQVSGTVSSNPQSQTYEGYVEAFRKSIVPKFSKDDLNEIFRDFSGFVITEPDTAELANAIEGRETTFFPLTKLKKEPFYDQTIRILLQSSNPYQRTLGYITLASAGDTAYNELLLKTAKTESNKDGKLWAGMALLYLRDSHTSELFDFLVQNEEFGDAHMLPLYLRLDKDSLRRTAYLKINAKDPKSKILAVQSLAETGLNPKTEQVVREAVKKWSPSIKGYAIYTLKSLGMGDLKELLSPLLKDESLRELSLEALANSPTREDQEYLMSLIPNNSEIPEDILNAYLTSKREDSVRTWLTLVRDGKIDPKYTFFTDDQPLLVSDIMLDAVRDTIRRTRNHSILRELPRTLAGRKDIESVNLLLQLLSDSDATVRYWAAVSLYGNSSPQLVKQIPYLISNADLRTVALTELAIQNKIDGLQDVYESLLQSDKQKSTDWYRSSLQYLAAFPREKDKELFKSILQSKKDAFVKRLAVRGLGNLHAETALPLIVEALHLEPPRDVNAITYLVALGKIKGAQSKQIVESYKNSKDATVRALVEKLLANW